MNHLRSVGRGSLYRHEFRIGYCLPQARVAVRDVLVPRSVVHAEGTEEVSLLLCCFIPLGDQFLGGVVISASVLGDVDGNEQVGLLHALEFIGSDDHADRVGQHADGRDVLVRRYWSGLKVDRKNQITTHFAANIDRQIVE